MRRVFVILAILVGSEVCAEVFVPARTIRAREVITGADLIRRPTSVEGALADPQEIIGREARVVLYPGRPIRPGDVGPPALINRNDTVVLVFAKGTLRIATEGRALGRGAVGESMRAMNMVSRLTVTGTILADGSIEVR